MQQVLPDRLLSGGEFGFFDFGGPQFGLEVFGRLSLLVLELGDLAFKLLLDLVGVLLLIIKLVGDVLVEKVRTLCQHLVAEFLGDRFSLWTFGSFL